MTQWESRPYLIDMLWWNLYEELCTNECLQVSTNWSNIEKKSHTAMIQSYRKQLIHVIAAKCGFTAELWGVFRILACFLSNK